VVFFDYNGDGVRDVHEPPILGATVQVGNLIVFSGEDGQYFLESVPKGKRQVKLVSAENFRYLVLSPETVQAIGEPVEIMIEGDTREDLGLMEGFLTLPVSCGAMSGLTKYVDLDYRLGSVRRWDGITSGPTLPDQHQGIDYHAAMDTPIVAAAPGMVIETAGQGSPDGATVRLIHDFGGTRKFVTDYAHCSKLLVSRGDHVARGQTIGLMGKATSGVIHVHFELWDLPAMAENSNAAVIQWIFDPDKHIHVTYPNGGVVPAALDPYRDVTNPESLSYWTRDNEPQCPR